eukprot:GHVL01026216.1.p1 GENE.GHVL01026216.1~~GHVL01026216.1.p1  ORF type:complete len:110 (+),score=27.45 GHVL01026216.1:503-832(+)
MMTYGEIYRDFISKKKKYIYIFFKIIYNFSSFFNWRFFLQKIVEHIFFDETLQARGADSHFLLVFSALTEKSTWSRFRETLIDADDPMDIKYNTEILEKIFKRVGIPVL